MKIVATEFDMTWSERPLAITIELVLDKHTLDGVSCKLRLKASEAQDLANRINAILRDESKTT